MNLIERRRDNKANKRGFSNGQGLVEFALALPLVALLILGVLEFGRAFQTKIVLTNAAREGTHYFLYDVEDSKNGFVNTRTAVETEAINSGVTFDTPATDIDILCFEDNDVTGVLGEIDNATDSDGDGFVDTGGEIVAVSTTIKCPSGSTIVIYVEKLFELAVIGSFVDPLPIHSDARMLVP